MASSKPDLTESLTASILPPFLSEGWNEQTGTRAKTSHDGSSQPENIPAQASIDGAGQEDVRKVETAARKTNEQAQAVNAPPKGSITQADDNGLSSGRRAAVLESSSGSSVSSPGATVAAGKDVPPASRSIEDLTSLVSSLGAKIVSSNSEPAVQPVTSTEHLINLQQQGNATPAQSLSTLPKTLKNKQAENLI